MENKATVITFSDALSQLDAFVADTRCDLDMAYDWICEMTGIDSICDDDGLWGQFFDAYYEAADWELINDLHESV